MGCENSKHRADPIEITSDDVSKDRKIQADLDRGRKEEEEKVKLLLLGTGESGKSTIFKQMRILYGSPNTEDDLRWYGVVVRQNIVFAIRQLCTLIRSLDLVQKLDEESNDGVIEEWEDATGMTPRQAYDQLIDYLVDKTKEELFPEVDEASDWVGTSPRANAIINGDSRLFLQHVEAIRVLWQSMTMKGVWMKRAQANVNDSHKDYLQDLTRIASSDYVPTTKDILITRVRTNQIIIERYIFDNIIFEVYDVGGQRSERRKWIDCFEGVDAVIFVAALSEYDQSLSENKRVNRMMEALDLFESVVKNRAFLDTSIMLFLNKKDTFAEKILYSDISTVSHFSDYAGKAEDFDQGVLYFIHKFEERLLDDEFKDSYIHVTCATDTNNMEFVLSSSRGIIMDDNLRKSGFLGSDC
mmetsp:Transcript_27112/g.32035  ORF Transcript_27112/g.32035 Transcript_27112/m.32035 type:complete len:413 (+) Transcript_27112:163-1401(+)|eukprot:CAMPEP_0198252286 /NCGR_PEP_ID=MMETSP1447-20131203/2803_1 /TAXON_ID=420782 /ORGANISM="Chaetoceros dichaeta, Strain CCMP1751" /LENGTH=412 /DNA_ID=CAMNT_0043937473 /DNA_START=119 /DNA_END=1357 /DNA_ORIENTATION=-